MNKRQAMHELIDKLLDLEESSLKKVHFTYSGTVNILDFYVVKNKLNHSRVHDEIFFNIYFDNKSFGTLEEQALESIDRIAEIAEIKDGPLEKVMDFKISESKARELGLISSGDEKVTA